MLREREDREETEVIYIYIPWSLETVIKFSVVFLFRKRDRERDRWPALCGDWRQRWRQERRTDGGEGSGTGTLGFPLTTDPLNCVSMPG